MRTNRGWTIRQTLPNLTPHCNYDYEFGRAGVRTRLGCGARSSGKGVL
jgi:hypothetical protein